MQFAQGYPFLLWLRVAAFRSPVACLARTLLIELFQLKYSCFYYISLCTNIYVETEKERLEFLSNPLNIAHVGFGSKKSIIGSGVVCCNAKP